MYGGITHKTFAKWIEILHLKYKRVFTPKQVRAIFDLLDPPY